jgi:hypothetical protein
LQQSHGGSEIAFFFECFGSVPRWDRIVVFGHVVYLALLAEMSRGRF